MVLKTGVKNNPATNSVLFQCVIEINFQSGLIMCAMLYNVNTGSKMKKKYAFQPGLKLMCDTNFF